MKRKIATLNFHYSNSNYGAVLQAAALQEFLRLHGFDTENINLIPKPNKNRYRVFLGSVKKKLLYFIRPSKHFMAGNSEVFDDFRSKWILSSVKEYNTLSELSFAELNYHAYVVGSDQVWRPVYTDDLTEAYFLSFVSDKKKKISYAASFGVDYWEQKDNHYLTNKLRILLERFDAISVREYQGVDICRDIFKVNAQHVLDPTLLVGRDLFDSIIAQDKVDKQEQNIVYYKLDRDEEFDESLMFLEREFGCISENIYYYEALIGNKKKYLYNSVPVWLAKIRDARLVVTDSYHCVCFAILFEKPFLYYPNQERGVARVVSLLSVLDINTKVIVSNNFDIETSVNYIKPDYDKVNSLLAKNRKISKKFLIGSIGS
jgi:hypothetical protein